MLGDSLLTAYDHANRNKDMVLLYSKGAFKICNYFGEIWRGYIQPSKKKINFPKKLNLFLFVFKTKI